MTENYYCFFPVRDGEKTIGKVMESLVNQTVLPSEIIVVDDGSTDKTAQILSNFEKKYSFVTVIHTNSKIRDYKRIPKLWNMCLRRNYTYQMIGAGDCIFELEYAEKIFAKLKENPKLVICSGDFGSKTANSPHGAGRFVRQSFFYENYEKYPEIVGYESEIIFRAIITKNEVKVFNEIEFEHADKLGGSHNFEEFAQGMKVMGYHPLYVLGRCWLEFLRNGEIGKKGSLRMLWKYLTFKPKQDGYYSLFPEDLRKNIRSLQSKKLKAFLKNPRKFRKLFS